MLNIERPQFIFLEFTGQRIMAYMEPGKSLIMHFDSASLKNSLVFSGQLAIENALWKTIGFSFFKMYPETWTDSLASPDEIMDGLKRNQAAALAKLRAVKTKTGAIFQRMTENDIRYFPAYKIWEVIYSKRNPLNSERKKWQQALKAVYRSFPLSNDNAVNSHFYQNMVTYYPRFLNSSAADKLEFEKSLQQVLQLPGPEATEEVKRKGKRYWEYRALQSILKGTALERTVAAFIDQGINIGELTWLQEAYSGFQLRFPKSRYRPLVDSLMNGYFSTQKINYQVLFEERSAEFKSLEQVLEKHRGRIVYIDLWGSWCGPCRQEFAYNKPLKDYFSGKPVDFLYIAFERNRGNPVQSWQKTANFYHLTGRHLLVNDQLQEDIEARFKPGHMKGFPTYILVDKEGKICDLDAKSPSSGNELYKQIESLLK